MRRFFYLLSFIALYLFGCSSNSCQINEKTLEDFNELMGDQTEDMSQYTATQWQTLNFYKEIYLNNFHYLCEQEIDFRIPKTLHFIWLGPKEFPEESIANVKSWAKYNPDWKILFWTDREDRQSPMDGMEKRLVKDFKWNKLEPFFNKTSNFGERSDILRYEILYQEGGVYVDHDVECFKSFDILNQSFDFYAGLEPFESVDMETKFSVSNSLIGVKSGHPILKAAMERVESVWTKYDEMYPQNDSFSTFLRVLKRTFDSFRLSIPANIGKDQNRDIVLPAAFFFAPYLPLEEGGLLKLKKSGVVFAFHMWKNIWADDKLLEERRQREESAYIATALNRLQRMAQATAVVILAAFLLLFLKKKRRRR